MKAIMSPGNKTPTSIKKLQQNKKTPQKTPNSFKKQKLSQNADVNINTPNKQQNQKTPLTQKGSAKKRKLSENEIVNSSMQQNLTPKLNITPNKSLQPSPKTPKVNAGMNMFKGTNDLSAAENVQNQSNNLKKKMQNKQGGNFQKKDETSTEQSKNRSKRRREKSKVKRAAIRQKVIDLKLKVIEGDSEARKEIEQKLNALESKTEKSNTCLRNMRFYKSILNIQKSNGNEKKSEVNKQNQKPNLIKQTKEINLQKSVKKQNENINKGKTLQMQQNKNISMLQLNQKKEESDEMEEEDESDAEDTLDSQGNLGNESEESDDEVEGEEMDDNEDEESDDDEESDLEGEEVDDEIEDEEVDDDDEEVEGEESNEDLEDAESNEENSDENEDEGPPPKKISKIVPLKNKTNMKTTPDNKSFNLNKSSRYVVFVGNIPYNATKEEINEHFKKVGEVKDVRIPLDFNTKKSKGFAYVELNNQVSYEKALSLHNTSIKGRRINVQYTKGGNSRQNNKNDFKAKNFKLQGMRKQGLLTGSVKADQKRNVRRAKKKQFEQKN